MWKALLHPAMIFIPFLLGILLPQAHILNQSPWNLVRWALIIMMFMSCLQISFKEMQPKQEHWRILGVNILMGIVPYYLVRFLWPDNQDLANAAFFVGITPTATAAPVVISFLGGNIAFALTGFAIVSIGISLALLFLLPLLTGQFTASFMLDVARTLLLVMFLPLAASALVRHFFPQAPAFAKKCKNFTFSLWSFTLFTLAATASNYFRQNPDAPKSTVLWIIAVSFVLCLLNFTTGYFLTRRNLHWECSQLLGQKNTTFTMFLAMHFGGPLAALGPIFYILWHNLWNAWQMYDYDKQQGKIK